LLEQNGLAGHVKRQLPIFKLGDTAFKPFARLKFDNIGNRGGGTNGHGDKNSCLPLMPPLFR
jgi:hypothetical protein